MGTRIGFPRPVIERLEDRKIIDGDCWRYVGTHCRDGYGRMMMGSRTDGTRGLRGVHQVSYEIHHGPIPEGTEVDHNYEAGCRFRDCWNPDHLRAITHRENTAAVSPEVNGRRIQTMRENQKKRWVTS